MSRGSAFDLPQAQSSPDSSLHHEGSVESQDSRGDGSAKQGFSAARRFARGEPDGDKSPMALQMPMPYITPGQLAFSAMRFLPVPVLVLNSLKTVVIANEAMGRLLGLISETETSNEESSRVLDSLNGQTLSQVGIDMIQNGRPVWVAWEAFFQSMLDEMHFVPQQQWGSDTHDEHGDATPTTELPVPEEPRGAAQSQTVIEVVISRHSLQKAALDPRTPTPKSNDNQVFAKMIVSVWDIAEHQTYFTLTFTSTESEPHPPPKRKHVARSSALESADKQTIATTSHPSSISSSHGSASSPSYRISPMSMSMSSSPFPPLGPPFKSMQSAPSVLQKMTIIKDTLLDNTETPIIAMWKDCTVAYPNAACRRLMVKHPDSASSKEGVDILGNWLCYSEDFSRLLDQNEYPIAVLLETQTPFSGMRVGMYQPDGSRVVFDILAEIIRDDETDEFLAGVVTCRDITLMSKEIDQLKVRELERFKTICDIVSDALPIVWYGSCILTLLIRFPRWFGPQRRMDSSTLSTADG